MSWRDRLKRRQPGSEGGAVEEAAPLAAVPESLKGSPASSREAVLAWLRDTVLELSDGKLQAGEIDPAAHIFDYGYVDSLSAVNLLASIQARYGVEVQEVDLVGGLSSLDALAEFVHAEAGGAR